MTSLKAHIRVSASLTALVAALGGPPTAAAADQPSAATVPAIVTRAVDAYTKDVQGFVGMQRHFSTSISAGPVHHNEQSDSGLLLNDGSFVALAYYHITRDGSAFTAAQIAERDTQTTQNWLAGKVFFKEPYDRHYVGDYRFDASVACKDCAQGTVAVGFSSAAHDAQHGAGTMWIDEATARVEKLTYVPYAFPPHATSGSATETTGEPLPNLWYVTRIEQTYGGRLLFVSGTGKFTAVVDHFQRFTTSEDGMAALHNGTI
jgi:hypothetical protein